MTNYREVLRLKSLGLNKNEIAQSICCSRNTVSAILQRAESHGLKWPLPDSLSDKDLAEMIYPAASGKPTFKIPDYEYVHRELQKNGVTLNLLWLEYCDSCRLTNEMPYQSTQFNKYYNDFLVKKNATMHLNHKPGEIMQVDWAGDKAIVTDTDTGTAIPAYIFVATLPYSGYSYVEAFFSMKQECWTTAHVNAYKFFGGVPRIIQCDNLKTGVERHGRDEITLNQTYRELAEHYSTAVIPTRIRSPKDKAMVEGTVGVISTFILAAMRNQQFLSLPELNTAIRERLETFNHKPFQKRDGSRATAFEEEKPFLLPLPPRPFELATWKVATVGPNYHIAVDGMNYSAPYEYIKQKVDVRITRGAVEILFDGNRICSHPRLHGMANQYSTVQDHMPPNHQQYVQWNGERFAKWAAKIGEKTETVVRTILTAYKVEQQGYKACMGLLKLADKYSAERLENACKKALTYTPRPSLKNVQAILSSGQDKIQDETPAQPASSAQYGFTRGADYYDRREG